jgi:Mrp family chromosome partitioning ATPase
MIVVLRLGTTDRRLAAAKLALLDRLPVSVVGAVLNNAEDPGGYEYYESPAEDALNTDADAAPLALAGGAT